MANPMVALTAVDLQKAPEQGLGVLNHVASRRGVAAGGSAAAARGLTALSHLSEDPMNVKLISIRKIPLLLPLGILLAGCASGPILVPHVLQRIESAHTRDDHLALATYFDQQAAVARSAVVEHNKMAKAYRETRVDPRAVGRMPEHCADIARTQEGVAMEYDGMASVHRQMAELARP